MIRKLPISLLMTQAVYFTILLTWIFSIGMIGELLEGDTSFGEYLFFGFWISYPLFVLTALIGLTRSLKGTNTYRIKMWNALPLVWIVIAVLIVVYLVVEAPSPLNHYE